MEKSSKIFIAGHNGMVGSSILRLLQKGGYHNIVYASKRKLDLRNQEEVLRYFDKEKPEYIVLAAGKVGGILANNSYKAEFIYDNLMIECNVIDAAYRYKSKKLLFLGSSCIYPKYAQQPMQEEALLTGIIEPTNEPYAIAKIAGIKLCESYRHQYGCNFISCMPTNLYGPGDNYDLKNCHVVPALIRKFVEAKFKRLPSVEIWGSGKPKREFLHVDDLAEACILLLKNYDEPGHINVGSGQEVTIRETAELIKKLSGYSGEIVMNPNHPDGTPRKLLDNTKIFALGWRPKVELEEGIKTVLQQDIPLHEWYQKLR